LQKYRYYLPPQSKLPFAAGILSGLLCLDNIYTLISMPHYTQYWDYWATLAAALLLCVFCFLFRQRRTELTLIPAAILALIACITPNLVHWLEVGMFFLLLLLWLLRLPKWVGTLCRLAGIVLTVSEAERFWLLWQNESLCFPAPDVLLRNSLCPLSFAVWAANC